MAGTGRRRRPDRNPIRYLNDGVSQTLLERPDGTRPRPGLPPHLQRARPASPRPHLPPAELPDDDYPFVLSTGRLQHQWHTLTRTGKVGKLARLDPGPFVEVHPEDARALGVAEGDHLEVASAAGARGAAPPWSPTASSRGPASRRSTGTTCSARYLGVNAVTHDAVDPLSFQPEFKVCAVALARTAAPSRRGRPGAPQGDRPRARTGRRVSRPGGGLPVHALAAAFGIVGLVPAPLAEPERRYLSGFLSGLALAPPDGRVPVLPPGAPFAPERAAWVDGVLAGMFSRAAADAPAKVPAQTGTHHRGAVRGAGRRPGRTGPPSW
ncbi:hypothetical protein LT493_10280 [Streptomyces tricolor]|nr:hypothetical protein [Streptomyces tricolor]